MASLGPGFALALAAAAGAGIAMQAGINAQLGRHLGHPLWAALASFGIGTVLIVPLLALWNVQPPDLARAFSGPLWIWTGGAIGLFFVVMALILAPITGMGAFLAAMIGGQMIAALVIDHFGLIGLAVRPVTFARIAGAALVFAGVYLIQTPKP